MLGYGKTQKTTQGNEKSFDMQSRRTDLQKKKRNTLLLVPLFEFVCVLCWCPLYR